MMPVPHRFRMLRDQDVTGVSGTGVVADGVQWPDGTVTVRWRGEHASTVQWETIQAANAVHGHGGRTRFEWLDTDDDPDSPPDRCIECGSTRVFYENHLGQLFCWPCADGQAMPCHPRKPCEHTSEGGDRAAPC